MRYDILNFADRYHQTKFRRQYLHVNTTCRIYTQTWRFGFNRATDELQSEFTDFICAVWLKYTGKILRIVHI